MRTHTNEFKEELKVFGRQIKGKITYYPSYDLVSESDDNILTEADLQIISEQANYDEPIEIDAEDIFSISIIKNGDLLQSLMKEFDFETKEELNIGSVVNPQFGLLVDEDYEYLNYGNYIINSKEFNMDTETWSYVCYDKMLFSMVKYRGLSNVEYPITIKQFIDKLCNKVGLEFEDSQFVNQGQLIYEDLYKNRDATYRDIFDEISKIVAGNLLINDNNKLEVGYPNKASYSENASGSDISIEAVEEPISDVKLEGDTQQNTSILPSGYTQVDYIESSGTQYIDSGILPSENIGFEIDFTPHNDMNKTTARTIFGSRTTWKSNGYQLTTYTEGSLNGGHFLFGTNNTASLIRHSAYMQKDVRCQISFLNGVFKSANGNETNIQGTFSNVNKNIYLFGCLEGTPFELSTTTLYRLKFYDNGNLIRDFIPCYRNSDNEVGLYDLVNNVFYTNQGTGAFTYGSVANIPNPDYPQNINVVAGEQDVEIVGKNLFDTSNLSNQTRVGVTTTFDNSKITFNGTSTAGVIFAKSDLGYKLKAGTYTFHFEDISGIYQNPSDKDLAIFLTNPSSAAAFGNVNLRRTRPYITFTITEETEIYLYMYINGKIIFDNWTIGFQIEEGSQATSYEPYKSQNYPIYLLGKNLFDKDNVNILNGWMDNNTEMNIGTSQNNRILYISCQPNTTYTVSRSILTSAFRVATYDSTPIPTVTTTNTSYVIHGLIKDNNATSITITTGVNAKYLLVHYGHIVNDTNINESLASIQIEKGSQATEYTPYFEPIELCKIGNYQDYIYNQNGDWYLHKEIGKVILNGGSNESYSYQNNHRFWLRRSYWTNETVPFNPPQNTLQGLYCNRFVERTRGQTWGGTEGISYDNPNTVDEPIGSTFDIACNSVATNENDFKTWLSNNPLEIVYILQNPQDTQITNTALIQQLDNLKNATLYNGVNNISASGDLPSILNLDYISEYESINEDYLKDTNVRMSERIGVINSVAILDSDNDLQYISEDTQSIKENEMTRVTITDNLIAMNGETQEIADNILNKLNGLYYYANDLQTTGVCYYDFLDMFNVEARGNIYQCLLLNNEITITQGIEEHIFTERFEEVETSANEYTTSVISNKAVQFKINQQEGRIESKVEKDGVISAINQSAEEIQIQADKLSLEGKNINLTGDNIKITGENLDIDSNGVITLTDNSAASSLSSETLHSAYIIESEDTVTRQGTTETLRFRNEIVANGRKAVVNDDWEYQGTTGGGKAGITEGIYSQPRLTFYSQSNDYESTTGSGSYQDLDISLFAGIQYTNIQNGTTSTPLIITPAGNITCVSLTQTSKEENKKNFEMLTNAKDILNKVDIYKYNYINEDNKVKKSIGFVIGDKFNYSEEITSTNNDGANIYSMVSVLWQVVKEQQEEINQLKEMIKNGKY